MNSLPAPPEIFFNKQYINELKQNELELKNPKVCKHFSKNKW